jgi:hypothetical protein
MDSSRIDRDCRRDGAASQQGSDGARVHCRGVLDDERGRRLCDHGSHAAYVQAQEIVSSFRFKVSGSQITTRASNGNLKPNKQLET